MESGDHAITIDGSGNQEDLNVNEEDWKVLERRLERETSRNHRPSSRHGAWMISRIPEGLYRINFRAVQPQTLSIGPYHQGRAHLQDFDEYKWSFLNSVLHRTRKNGIDLQDFVKAMKHMEERARGCYSESFYISSMEFVEMMILDGCLIVEFLRHFAGSGDDAVNKNDPIVDIRRDGVVWKVIVEDLLKLENQLPYFVLESIYELSKVPGAEEDPLELLALNFFELVLYEQSNFRMSSAKVEAPMHLLHLYYLSLRPSTPPEYQNYQPSFQSIQRMKALRTSGIKFSPSSSAESFLEINFQSGMVGGVLHIPPIPINDFTMTVLINCLALEQQNEYLTTFFSTYITFMSSLITSSMDVGFLCDNKIITSFTENEERIAKYFRELRNYAVFNIRDCYLSKAFADVDAHYDRMWVSFKRTYFSTTWTFVSVLSAFIILVLTVTQTVFALLSFHNSNGKH